MDTVLERLVVRMVGDTGDYVSKMKEARAESDRFGLGFERHQVALAGFRNSLRGYAGSIVSMVSGIAGGFGLLNSVIGGVKLFASFERAEIEFGTMLGGIEEGKKMMADLQKLAAQTPLELGPLQQGTQMLLQFGIKGEYAVGILRMLGDVTGGSAEKMLRMARAYGQMVGTGRLQGDELNQMIEAGFNPLQALAEKAAGKDNKAGIEKEMQRLMKRKESGQLSVGEVTEAFKLATSEGGRYFKNMENASKSLEGTFSTMIDDLNSVRRGFGETVTEVLGLKQIMLNISGAAQVALDVFRAIPAEMKKWVIIGGAVAAFAGTMLLVWPIVATTLGTVVSLFGALAGMLAPLAILKGLFFLMITPLLAIKAAFLFIFSPATIGLAAVAAGVYLILTQTTAWSNAVEFVTKTVKDLIAYFKPLYEGLRAAFATGDMDLAWKIFVTGLELELAKFEVWFTEYWNATKDVFVDGWHDGTTDIALTTVDLIEDLKTNWTEYFDWFLKWSAIIARTIGDQELGAALEAIRDADVEDVQEAARLAREQIKETAKAEQEARRAGRDADLDAARQRQTDIQKQLDADILTAKWREAWKKMFPDKGPEIPPPQPPAAVAVKLIPKWDAASFDSAEAQSRISEYVEKFRMGAAGAGLSATAGSMTLEEGKQAKWNDELMKLNGNVERLVEIQKQVAKKKALVIATADLGPGGDTGFGDW